MKTAIVKISALFLLLSFLEVECEKRHNDPLKDGNGKIAFYTNAQAVINCGPFNVDIFINNDSVGFISEPYVGETYPECINSPETLIVEKKPGTYNYSAKMNCGQYGYWVDEIEVLSDKCVYVFLDMFNCKEKTN